MKKIITTLVLLGSMSVFAGDLHVNCYINNDQGNYLALSDLFADNQAFLDFKFKNKQYEVTVRRTNQFGKYTYEVNKIGRKLSENGNTIKISNDYSLPVDIDENLSCVIND